MPWEAQKTIHKDRVLWGHNLLPLGYVGAQAFLKISREWGWEEVLKSWHALLPYATWLELHLSAEDSARIFLRHLWCSQIHQIHGLRVT